MLQIDANIAAGTRGRYDKLCIQVDLDTPLPRSILIGRFRQDILYEGIGSLCFSCGRIGHQKNHFPYSVKDMVVEMDKGDESELKRNDNEVAEGTNLDEKEAGDDRGDYGLWMLVRRKKQASKSRVICAHLLKSNLGQISALNATNLGRLIRLYLEVNPPTWPPTASLDGKCKIRRFENSSLDMSTFSLSQETTASDAPQSELSKTTFCPSFLEEDPIGTHLLQFQILQGLKHPLSHLK